MSFKLKSFLLVIVASTTTTAFAGTRSPRQPLQVDFNKMIDENNIDRGELAKVTASEQARQEPAADRRRKVIDFVDMEVGLGQPSHVVNRD